MSVHLDGLEHGPWLGIWLVLFVDNVLVLTSCHYKYNFLINLMTLLCFFCLLKEQGHHSPHRPSKCVVGKRYNVLSGNLDSAWPSWEVSVCAHIVEPENSKSGLSLGRHPHKRSPLRLIALAYSLGRRPCTIASCKRTLSPFNRHLGLWRQHRPATESVPRQRSYP